MPATNRNQRKSPSSKKPKKVSTILGDCIRIRGARANNLKGINIDIPRDAFTVITGVSGSGKSSLAFDTLFAEGQRQYIESLSAYARQFLNQIPRPDVDSIAGLAPTLAIDQKPGTTNARSTVATVTEIYDYLRLLFARVGTPHCAVCGSTIAHRTPDSIRDSLLELPTGTKLVLMAPMVRGRRGEHREVFEQIRVAGLIRARVDGEIYLIDEVPALAPRKNHTIEAVVDRLVVNAEAESRLSDSISLALRLGEGLLSALVMGDSPQEQIFNTKMSCAECGASFSEIEPRTFSFNSPYGACEECEGVGFVGEKNDLETCPTCEGGRLRAEALAVTIDQVAINQVTAWPISQCLEWFEDLHDKLSQTQQKIANPICREVINRLQFLCRVQVQYLSLDRRANSLSGGELQRVRLATSIGSGLVGVCYVLDEPSIGLHAADHDRLIGCLRDLQALGNTLVVVEHDEATMMAADYLIDIGPSAGDGGGKIVSQGTPQDVCDDPKSLTGRFLSGGESIEVNRQRRTPVNKKAWLELRGVTANNLDNVDVRFPLGCMTGVTGVSGSGKSSLINGVLRPAIAKHLGLQARFEGEYKKLVGASQIDKLIPIDQSPIGRSPRSCPATYAGVLDEIRKVFAATRQAKTRGFTSSRFSFNSAAGQCEACKGHGVQRIEMNFLSDLFVVCDRCGGRRFNRQTLQIRFKDVNVADVLDMTVDQATEFFENVPKISRLLSALQSVGLGYVHLGQPSTTLSGGEAQRIKLGTELAKTSTGSSLYILDEPTTGLHFADVQRLIGVLQRIVDAGNTVIVIEHNLDFAAACDWLIDMGPGGGSEGGQVVGFGTPEELCKDEINATGRFLAAVLATHTS